MKASSESGLCALTISVGSAAVIRGDYPQYHKLRRQNLHGLRLRALILRPIHRRDSIAVNLSRFHAAVAIARRVRDIGDLLECAAAHGPVETIAGQIRLGVALPNE